MTGWINLSDKYFDSQAIIVPGGLLIRSEHTHSSYQTGSSRAVAQTFIPCTQEEALDWIEKNKEE